MRILTAEQVADIVFRLRDENLTRHMLSIIAASMAYRGRQLVAAFGIAPPPPHPLALSQAMNDLRGIGMRPEQVNDVKTLLQKTIRDMYTRIAKNDTDEPDFECSDQNYIGLLPCTEITSRTWQGVKPVYLQFQTNLAGEAHLLTIEYTNGKTTENNVFPAPK